MTLIVDIVIVGLFKNLIKGDKNEKNIYNIVRYFIIDIGE